MPKINIEGTPVEVGDEFFRLSPEEQDAAVDEIAGEMGLRSRDRGHQAVPEYVPPGVESYDPSAGMPSGSGKFYNRDTGMVEPKMNAAGTFASAGVEGVPIIGGWLDDVMQVGAAGVGSLVSGEPYSRVRAQTGRMVENSRERHPIARTAGNITGALVALGPLARTPIGGAVLGTRGTLGTRLLTGGLSSSLLSSADTLARGGSWDDAKRSAAIGGAAGLAFPAAGRAISQLGGKAAVAAAPSIEALKETGRQLYRRAHSAGIAVKPAAFEKSMHNMVLKLRGMGADPELHPKFARLIERMDTMRGRPQTLQDLDILRQLASEARKEASDGDAARLSVIIDEIDRLVDDDAAFAVAGNLLRAPGSASTTVGEGLDALKQARAYWHTARKSETIEELFRRAQIKADGAGAGPVFAAKLKSEFQSLVLRKDWGRGFTKAEKSAILAAASGTNVGRIMSATARLTRSLFGTGLAGSAGYASGGPLGAAGALAASRGVGAVAGRIAAKRGIGAAERAAATVRTGGGARLKNYPSAVGSPLENAGRTAPVLTHDFADRNGPYDFSPRRRSGKAERKVGGWGE